MANKKFFWVMLVMVLALGMVLVGCSNPAKGNKYTYTFINESSYKVEVTCSDLSPKSFSITAGDTKTATSAKTSVLIQYSPANYVTATSNNILGIFTFTNR